MFVSNECSNLSFDSRARRQRNLARQQDISYLLERLFGWSYSMLLFTFSYHVCNLLLSPESASTSSEYRSRVVLNMQC